MDKNAFIYMVIDFMNLEAAREFVNQLDPYFRVKIDGIRVKVESGQIESLYKEYHRWRNQ